MISSSFDASKFLPGQGDRVQMPKIHFVDVTNGDTVQASRIRLPKFQKTMLNCYLAQMGIHQSEFAFPCTRHEQNYVRANLQLRELGAMGGMVLEGWCRAIVSDVSTAMRTGVKNLNISISTSDQMIRHKFRGKLDREMIIHEMTESVVYAKQHGVETVGVNAEDASRTDMGYLIEFAKAAKQAGGARRRYGRGARLPNPPPSLERRRA